MGDVVPSCEPVQYNCQRRYQRGRLLLLQVSSDVTGYCEEGEGAGMGGGWWYGGAGGMVRESLVDLVGEVAVEEEGLNLKGLQLFQLSNPEISSRFLTDRLDFFA